jgi:hypothetical protein
VIHIAREERLTPPHGRSSTWLGGRRGGAALKAQKWQLEMEGVNGSLKFLSKYLAAVPKSNPKKQTQTL